MGAETVTLAVLLRQAQWLLDDLASHVGAGRLDAREFADTATVLDEISLLLREKDPVPIDVEGPAACSSH